MKVKAVEEVGYGCWVKTVVLNQPFYWGFASIYQMSSFDVCNRLCWFEAQWSMWVILILDVFDIVTGKTNCLHLLYLSFWGSKSINDWLQEPSFSSCCSFCYFPKHYYLYKLNSVKNQEYHRKNRKRYQRIMGSHLLTFTIEPAIDGFLNVVMECGRFRGSYLDVVPETVGFCLVYVWCYFLRPIYCL